MAGHLWALNQFNLVFSKLLRRYLHYWHSCCWDCASSRHLKARYAMRILIRSLPLVLIQKSVSWCWWRCLWVVLLSWWCYRGDSQLFKLIDWSKSLIHALAWQPDRSKPLSANHASLSFHVIHVHFFHASAPYLSFSLRFTWFCIGESFWLRHFH